MKFVLVNENTGKRWEFEINMTLNEFDQWQNTQDYMTLDKFDEFGDESLWGNHYNDFISEMGSSYGVLDLGGGDETERYHSDEIKKDDFPIVLEKFKEFFKQKGLPVS